MASQTFFIRPFAWSDLPALATTVAKAGDPTVDATGDDVKRLERDLRMPGRTPDRDCFVAVAGEAVVGYALANVEAPLRRIVISVGSLEGWRGAVERPLVETVIQHARTLDMAVVQADVPEGAAAGSLYRALGFDVVRTHLHLRRAGGGLVAAATPDGVTLRPLTLNDVTALTDLQNAAFEGSWGYSPNVPEEIRYRVFDLPIHGPDDVTLLFEGDALAAYCWAHVEGPGKPGFIGMVGTHPSRQGHGLGRVVTTAGLNRLVDRGYDPIDITVDSANTTAIRLYESLGFVLDWRSLWYQQSLEK